MASVIGAVIARSFTGVTGPPRGYVVRVLTIHKNYLVKSIFSGAKPIKLYSFTSLLDHAFINASRSVLNFIRDGINIVIFSNSLYDDRYKLICFLL